MWRFNEEQEKIIKRAKDAVFPLVEQWEEDLHYIVTEDINGDIEEDFIGYEHCGNRNCEYEAFKQIFYEYHIPIHRLKSYREGDTDHASIERCIGCYAPLVLYITWIRDEFDFLRDEVKTKQDVIDNAYEIYVIFDSVPSCDHEISPYDKADKDRLIEALKEQAEFISSIVNFSENLLSLIKKS